MTKMKNISCETEKQIFDFHNWCKNRIFDVKESPILDNTQMAFESLVKTIDELTLLVKRQEDQLAKTNPGKIMYTDYDNSNHRQFG